MDLEVVREANDTSFGSIGLDIDAIGFGDFLLFLLGLDVDREVRRSRRNGEFSELAGDRKTINVRSGDSPEEGVEDLDFTFTNEDTNEYESSQKHKSKKL